MSLATMFTIQTAVTIVTAGIAVELFGISTNIVYWGIAITFICSSLLLFGRYGLLDRGMKIIILVLSVSTIIAAFLAFDQSKLKKRIFEEVNKQQCPQQSKAKISTSTCGLYQM